MIHPSAIIAESAEIARDVHIGPFCVIADRVVIGSGCHLHAHVVVGSGCTIGSNNHFYQFCSIGEDGQHLRGETDSSSMLNIGDNNTFREYCSLHKGIATDDKLTRIGSGNYLMAYSHFAHDCMVGDNNVLANDSQIAGHVEIGDYVNIGGGALVHQFSRIGSYAMIGGGSVITRDVPAFTLVATDAARARSINTIGMKRNKFTREQIANVQRAFKLLYVQNNTTEQAMVAIAEQCGSGSEITLFIASLRDSTRGIIKRQPRDI